MDVVPGEEGELVGQDGTGTQGKEESGVLIGQRGEVLRVFGAQYHRHKWLVSVGLWPFHLHN